MVELDSESQNSAEEKEIKKLKKKVDYFEEKFGKTVSPNKTTCRVPNKTNFNNRNKVQNSKLKKVLENNNKHKDQDDTECESMEENKTSDDGTLPFSPRDEELLSPEISLMSPFLSISSNSPKKKKK